MKLKNNKIGSVTILVALLALAGCYYDKADQLYPDPNNNPSTGGNTCDTTAMSYASVIKPIIKQYCTDPNCHSGSGTVGSYNLTTYAGLKQSIDNMRLLGAINHSSGYIAMPQGLPKLSECNINKITAWVNQGALDN